MQDPWKQGDETVRRIGFGRGTVVGLEWRVRKNTKPAKRHWAKRRAPVCGKELATPSAGCL